MVWRVCRAAATALFLLSSIAYARPTVRNVKDKREFDKLLKHHAENTGLPVIVDFFSESCGPCRMIAPAYQALAKEYKDKAVFAKVDVNRNQQTSGAMGVRSMPTFMFFLGGKKRNEFSGAGESQLRQFTRDLVKEAERQNIKLTVDALADFYAQHDASKPEADIIDLHGKCVKGAASSVSSASVRVAKPGECVGAAADELSRKLKKKYGSKPKLVKRFGEGAGAGSSFSSSSSSSSSSSRPSSRPSSRAKPPPPQPEKANLHLASDDDIIAELARRGIVNPAGVVDEEEDEEEEEEEEEDYDDEEPPRYQPGKFPERVTVIGGGPAGLAAAIYAARAGLRPVVVAPPFGGQLMGKGVDVENYPGLLDQTGPGVVQLMQKQARDFGTLFEEQLVTRVDFSTHPYTVYTERSQIKTHAVIVATGADSRWLGAPGEQEYRGGGVSACATCDGFLFRDRPVVVVGGGDTAMEDALVLARTSSAVTIIHRRDTFRASHALAQRVLNHDKIQVLWNATVSEFKGEVEHSEDGGEPRYRLTHVVVQPNDGSTTRDIDCDGAFVAIGHQPNTWLFKDKLSMEQSGYLNTFNGSTATSVPGVYAAGDVADHVYRQAITSAGSGAMASLDAERWLSSMGYGNEEEEFGEDLMAEIMADFATDGEGGVNAYDDLNDSSDLVGRKESLSPIDEDDEADESEILKWAADMKNEL